MFLLPFSTSFKYSFLQGIYIMSYDRPLFPIPLKLRYKGVFDFKGVYELVYRWYRNRQFRFHERRYKDKTYTPLGNEIEANVWGEKEVTEFYKYHVTVDYHLWEAKEIPVIIKGKKVKRMRARIDIRLDGKVVCDWQNRYDRSNPFQNVILNFLIKTVLKYELEVKHVDPLDKDLHNLEEQIKKHLKIESDASGVEGFY